MLYYVHKIKQSCVSRPVHRAVCCRTRLLYNEPLYQLFREELTMDASRYFTAMHNAMSAQHPCAQLLLTVKLQDTCGNDACLELKQLPGESTSILCYSTMGRRCLNFQLFRKGWQLCHNADGQLVGRFPSSADGLIDETDFRAYCREDRLDLARTQRILSELRALAGADHQGSIPQNARTGAVVTVESFVGAGARWTYWSQDVLPSLPLGAILYWLADHLAGAERRTLQADPQAARLAAQWMAGDTAVFFHPSVPMTAMNTVSSGSAPAHRRTTVPAARNKSWQSIMAVMAGM